MKVTQILRITVMNMSIIHIHGHILQLTLPSNDGLPPEHLGRGDNCPLTRDTSPTTRQVHACTQAYSGSAQPNSREEFSVRV